MSRRKNRVNVVALGDLHIPYQDQAALSAALEFVRKNNPKNIVLLGDMLDLPQASRHGGNETKTTVEQDLGALRGLVYRLRASTTGTRIYYCLGNHEVRLAKLNGLSASHRAVASRQILHMFDEFADHVTPYMDSLVLDGVTYTHGAMSRKGAGSTARAMIELYGTHIVCGHTHRAASVASTTAHGEERIGIEAGCLRSLDVDWCQGTPDWQHAICVQKQPNKPPRLVRIKSGECEE